MAWVRRKAPAHDLCLDLFPRYGVPRRTVSGPQMRVRSRRELARQRRPRGHHCWDHLIAAPLWPMHGANLGTLLRTCDAVGACLAVPRLPWVPEALARGNTLRHRACVHWTGRDVCDWLQPGVQPDVVRKVFWPTPQGLLAVKEYPRDYCIELR
jgi:hypothetical protein